MSSILQSLWKSAKERSAEFPITVMSTDNKAPSECGDIIQCINVLDVAQCMKRWEDKCPMVHLIPVVLKGQDAEAAYGTIKKIQTAFPRNEIAREGFRVANEALYPTTTDKISLLGEACKVYEQCIEKEPENAKCMGYRAYFGYWHGQHIRNTKIPALTKEPANEGWSSDSGNKLGIQKLYNDYIMNLRRVRQWGGSAVTLGETAMGSYYQGMAEYELTKLFKEKPEVFGGRVPGVDYKHAALLLEKGYMENPRSHCSMHTGLCYSALGEKGNADVWFKKCLIDAQREKSLKNIRICEEEGRRSFGK